MPEEKPTKYTRSQEIFLSAPPEVQKLVRDVLSKEREVAHLPKRTAIYQDIYSLIRRHIA